ncbi:MAG: 6-phosphofructokinase [Actinobacteria bacterium]|nr:6-phosphofructokinase [Actinomycetota bacterium]MDI6830538.1 ATP-dependent 6-phosphofructokinase [Actinomycetota bacterium]
MASIRRIGILTGGGDCPGLNAVIRAVTKSAIFEHGLEVAGISEGFGGLIENNWRLLGDEDVSGILPRGGTILGANNRDNPFMFRTVTAGGEVTYEDNSGTAIANLEGMGVEALIVAGGDGTLSIARKLHERGVSVVGIPKTIDNDLHGTDVSFGFDSALHTATDAVDKLHTTAASHHRGMVLEVMGRNAGWLALCAGIAGGGDIILIPEIPYTFENVVRAIEERRRRGKRFSIIVVAEGAPLPGGEQVTRDTGGGERVLGGIGERVAEAIQEMADMETRVTILGHLQRGGSPSPLDRILATGFGTTAVELAAAGRSGVMVALRDMRIEAVPLEEVVPGQRRVPTDGNLVNFARSVGTSFGD